MEVALNEIDRAMGDVYGSPADHLEFQYTARVSFALNKAFGAPIGKSFSMTYASQAAIDVVIVDIAAKAAVVEPVGYASPSKGTSFSNEVIFTFSGDSSVVFQAVIAAREVGLQLLFTLDPTEIRSNTTPYI
ncbi:MAG: propanediol utilization microcompartment protein PduB [Candidatus Malihini olakiniferum]